MVYLSVIFIVIGAILLAAPLCGGFVSAEKIKTWFLAAALLISGLSFIVIGVALIDLSTTTPKPYTIHKTEVYTSLTGENLYRIWIEDGGTYYYLILTQNEIGLYKEENCQIYISDEQMRSIVSSKNLKT